MQPQTAAKQAGIFGWNYNRANYKFDQGLRWQRFTVGRKMACSQVGMFRQDISDLAGVSMAKLKVYGPIYGIVITVCVTVFVEGRSGLKFPGPPVFISGVYLQCLATGMSFMALATWLLFHATMRAQVACIQLRTRIVRMPVPTQKQLDGSRKILSTWEEQGLYDMFRIPFVMPNGVVFEPEDSEGEDEGEQESHAKAAGYAKGGLPGVAAQVKSKLKEAHHRGATTTQARIPGFTPGHPSWYEKELEEVQNSPNESPRGEDAPMLKPSGSATVPYKHFELLRNAQKDWWGCEAYMRVCFLFGMMHLIMAFSYWITLHNIAELGMVWCSNLGAAGLTAGVWIMFRIDVLPEHGGSFPFEIGGPFVTSIALGLMYSHQVTQTMMDVARGVAAGIIIMHIILSFRMYSISKPNYGRAHHKAKEAGGRLFNESASCDVPAWLPSAFQHVMYLVAPPKTAEQLERESRDRENNTIKDDPLAKVDMTPWIYVRTMIFAVALGWFVQLGGHACECVMGERMLMSNPGMPPWTRAGQWYGWEHGPVSSKHYAHVTPQRGHWAWQKGWGPQGQQELWASDMFGFAPEADAWWAEAEGPEPLVGAAGLGQNTWGTGVIAYGQNEPKWGKEHADEHDWLDSGGHRRLSAVDERPVVPLPVSWPHSLEPDLLACSPDEDGHKILALTAAGTGIFVRGAGQHAAEATPITFEGLLELGLARSMTWGPSALLAVTGVGKVASCALPSDGDSVSSCSEVPLPPLPGHAAAAAAVAYLHEGIVRVATAHAGRVAIFDSAGDDWAEVGAVFLPEMEATVVAVAAVPGRLLVTSSDGTAYNFRLKDGLPASARPFMDRPAAVAARRTWQSSCMLAGGDTVIRLASSWKRVKGGGDQLRPELFL